MKKKHFLLLLFLCLLASAQAQWQLIHTGFDMSFYDVECISEDTVFLCGGSILKTTNGGGSWTEKYHGTTSARYIEFADSKVGYAGYQNLLKTTDGGENWFELDISTYEMGTLYGIYVVDADTLFAYSSAKLFKSTDGGLSWSEKLSLLNLSYEIKDFLFIDEVGYLVSNRYVFKSVDYGETWNIKIDGTYVSFFEHPDFNLMFSSQDKNHIKIHNHVCEMLLQTTDGFESYEVVDTHYDYPTYYRYDLKFLSAQYGCIAGSDGLNGTSAVFITKDGGYNWKICTDYTVRTWVYAIDGFGDSTFYIASTDGLIYRTPYKPVSVNEQIVEQNIQLHPNPVKDVLYINAPYPIEQLVVYNPLGNEILHVDAINTTEFQIDISWLKTGVYLLKTQSATNTSIQKFIKQ